MLKIAVCTVLFACSFGVNAADWQKEFTLPSLTNELPPSRGVAVDDQGYVHLQAYNRHPWSNQYSLAHQYTIDASGQVPWIWGVSLVSRMSDCGVYAKSGQRLDCFRVYGSQGEETRLEMRSTNGLNIAWQSSLPAEVTLLDAAVGLRDDALLFGRIDSSAPDGGTEFVVLRANSFAPAEVLSVVPACPSAGQTLTTLRTQMPKEPWQPIRVVKACWNSFGTTDLIVDVFYPQTGHWFTGSPWVIPYGVSLARAEIGSQGHPYALIEHSGGLRELLTARAATHGIAEQWLSIPFPVQGKIAAFLAGQQGLAVVAMNYSDGPGATLSGLALRPEYSIHWLDQDSFESIIHHFGDFDSLSPKAFALSSAGDVLVLGSPSYSFGGDVSFLNSASAKSEVNAYASMDRVVLARRNRELVPIAELTLAPNEADVGTTYLIGGPNNVAVVARTIARDIGWGTPEIGVRVNQYDLPPSP
jgi:hypothetical protein